MKYAGRAAKSSATNLGSTKFEYGAVLAACLSAVLIKQRDAVGLSLFDTAGRAEIRPSARRSQLLKIVSIIEGAAPGGKTDLGTVVSPTADQMHRRGLVIVSLICSPNLDSFYTGLGKLQHAGHDVLVFHVLHRDELEFPFDGSVIFRDIEGDEEIFAEPRAFRTAYRDRDGEFHGRHPTAAGRLRHRLSAALHRRRPRRDCQPPPVRPCPPHATAAQRIDDQNLMAKE